MNYNIKDAQGILVDYRVDKVVKAYLNSLNKEVIYTPRGINVMEAINGHPDIFACPVGKVTVIEPILFQVYKEKLSDYNVICGNQALKSSYPEDVLYNVAVLGNFVIGRKSYVDKTLLAVIEEQKYKFIDVNQGYTKCSIAIVNEESVITSDSSIEKACKDFLDVELIDVEDNIKLSDFYGFVGGASFNLGNNLVFFGDYKKHRDFKKIEKFCISKGVRPTSIGSGELVDYGGVVPLYK